MIKQHKLIFFYLLLINGSLFAVAYKLTYPSYNPGLFSVFHTVLGALDFYENSPEVTALVIDFENRGLYYDPHYGLNCWEYYFEPICLGLQTENLSLFADSVQANFANSAHLGMSRERGNELIKKYIHLKPHLELKLNDFIQKHFAGKHVIGVHYRGTDKKKEAELMAYEDVANRISQDINLQDNIKFFVATDDDNFMLFMHKKFPEKIISLDAVRSKDQNPVHCTPGNEYRKGEEAVLDCLLLSRCAKLYKMVSNLSDASTKFNPSIIAVNLNKYYSNTPNREENVHLSLRELAKQVSDSMWLIRG